MHEVYLSGLKHWKSKVAVDISKLEDKLIKVHFKGSIEIKLTERIHRKKNLLDNIIIAIDKEKRYKTSGDYG